jgi:hypothetical protein
MSGITIYSRIYQTSHVCIYTAFYNVHSLDFIFYTHIITKIENLTTIKLTHINKYTKYDAYQS